MIVQEEKKQFVLKAIAPYYKDKNNCAGDGKHCFYLMSDGRKCVFGQFLRNNDGSYPNGRSAAWLLNKYGENILIDEAQNKLSRDEWNVLQDIHDLISTNEPEEKINYHINKLAIFSVEELQEYCKNN